MEATTLQGQESPAPEKLETLRQALAPAEAADSDQAEQPPTSPSQLSLLDLLEG